MSHQIHNTSHQEAVIQEIQRQLQGAEFFPEAKLKAYQENVRASLMVIENAQRDLFQKISQKQLAPNDQIEYLEQELERLALVYDETLATQMMIQEIAGNFEETQLLMDRLLAEELSQGNLGNPKELSFSQTPEDLPFRMQKIISFFPREIIDRMELDLPRGEYELLSGDEIVNYLHVQTMDFPAMIDSSFEEICDYIKTKPMKTGKSQHRQLILTFAQVYHQPTHYSTWLHLIEQVNAHDPRYYPILVTLICEMAGFKRFEFDEDHFLTDKVWQGPQACLDQLNQILENFYWSKKSRQLMNKFKQNLEMFRTQYSDETLVSEKLYKQAYI